MPAVLASNKYIPSPTLSQLSPLDEPFYDMGCQCYWPAFLTSLPVSNFSQREVSGWGKVIENMNPLDLDPFFKQRCSEDRQGRVRNQKSLHLSGTRWESVWAAEVRQRCHCQLTLYDFPRILNQQPGDMLWAHILSCNRTWRFRPTTVTAMEINF